jgi:nudix-type nucleoside diphosphatase (YffH/AdpP family)
MIAAWVSARLRGDRETADLPQIGPEGQDRLQVLSRTEPYAKFFSVEELTLRHRRHRGDWTPEVLRAVFVSGDATVVLPWDPVRDTVLLIDQFRAAPAARGDLQPWFYETVAGRVDPGETPETAALREALEEAGLPLRQLLPGPHNYPSPGMLAEFLYLYVGIADLPETAAGFGGLDAEDEDIRSHILPRAELTRMAMSGQIRNGPLLSLALWLELAHEDLRRKLPG